MSFSRYFAELLRRSEQGAPSMLEAQRDYQNALALSTVAFGYSI